MFTHDDTGLIGNDDHPTVGNGLIFEKRESLWVELFLTFFVSILIATLAFILFFIGGYALEKLHWPYHGQEWRTIGWLICYIGMVKCFCDRLVRKSSYAFICFMLYTAITCCCIWYVYFCL